VTGWIREATLFILLLAAAWALAACGEPEGAREDQTHGQEDAPLPRDVRVTVTDRERQPIEGWGISVVGDTENEPLVVPNLGRTDVQQLDRLIFDEAGVNLVRVFGPGYGTQLETGRSSASPAERPRITGDLRPRRDDPRFAFMKRVRPYGVRFMLTGADAPGELKAPGAEALASGAEARYADYLLSFLGFARDQVGVPFEYVAVGNEPDNGRSLLTLAPSQAERTYELLAERLQSEGSPIRLVVGDNTTWPATLTYARAALAEPAVGASAAAIASHAYGGSSEEMRAVAELARARGLPVWQTEWGTGCVGCPDEDSMEVALRWSEQIAAALVDGEASAWFAFRGVASSGHGPGDGLVVRTPDEPEPFHTTKRFDVFRQYSSVAGPGSRRLETEVSGDQVLAVGFKSSDGVAVVLTNLAPQAANLSLDLGSRNGRLSGRRTDSEASFQALPHQDYAGHPLDLSVPAQSVTTLIVQMD
jgi:O-glycosyl hydrolase